jgi:drug/metabolite transporter (DMT)-like permease
VRTERLAPAALVLATVAVSFSAIFIRLADADAAVIVWVRMAMTLVLLAPWLARDLRRGALPRKRGDAALVGLSGVCLAAHFLTWTASLRYTSVASSILLVSLHPVLVAVLGRRLLGEVVSFRLAAGIALALAGTAVTCAGDVRLGGRAVAGDALAIAGAVTFTGYLLVGRTVRPRYGAVGYSGLVYAAAAVIAVTVAAAGGGPVLPSARAALACAGLAVVCTILGHTIFNWTLRHLRAAVVSVAFLGEPPITVALAVLILSQSPPGTALLGGAVILAGVGLALSERPVAPAELPVMATAE